MPFTVCIHDNCPKETASKFIKEILFTAKIMRMHFRYTICADFFNVGYFKTQIF